MCLGKRAPYGFAVGVDEPIQCLRMVSHRLGEFDAAGVETTGEIPQRSNDFRLKPVRAAAEGAGHLVQVARHRSADAAGQMGDASVIIAARVCSVIATSEDLASIPSVISRPPSLKTRATSSVFLASPSLSALPRAAKP